ncbi:HNH endonuclease signature motif containing protein [Mycobacterium sp. 1245805.9]|uniref:HNH endonuclease n=1 Tax=Mycobacterium sp. 1245805.9 TaxID=1856862 RepID=UPI0007FF2B72|nr:HNH endonuclease signature motif containing protein [Mycobacterium sp. 1245805.9]OBI90107.1 HNH endonuclease [Mycobacterium sp. 1245805.9]
MFEHDPGEAALIARIAELERSKSAASAEQARAAASLDTLRRANEAAAGMPAAQRGRGLASEIALARRDSPARGGRYLGFAKALVHEMPHTLAALEAGRLSEWRATLIVRESACLDVEDRRLLDSELCADGSKLDGMGDARVVAAARAIAYRLNAQAVVDRAAKAESERTVTIRPAPDTMTYVTALLPVAKGVAVYAALKRAADTTFDDRTRGQVMADTLVERITGRPADAAEPIAVNLLIPGAMLFGDDDGAAVVDGYGPIPAAVARQLVSDAVADSRSRATLRRLYRHPGSGALVAMESRARRFPKGLATFIGLRDQGCRTPYCDAPIRHYDHATPHRHGGPTSAANGLGMCERCNYAKEAPGWRVTAAVDETGGHRAEFETPTGMRYHSGAPPPPGPFEIFVSELEARIAIALPDLHAA